jgi:EthD domain
MLRLTVLVKRHPELSIEEFHERWRAHGRMIADEPAFHRMIRRYEQHHRAVPDYRNGDTYDGVAVQHFDDMAGFVAFLEEPAYAAKVRPDEQTLLDMERLVVLFTEMPEVFIE